MGLQDGYVRRCGGLQLPQSVGIYIIQGHIAGFCVTDQFLERWRREGDIDDDGARHGGRKPSATDLGERVDQFWGYLRGHIFNWSQIEYGRRVIQGGVAR